MFNELLESTLVKKNTTKRWPVVVSTLVQTVILGVLVMIPLMYTEALPKTMLSILLVPSPIPPAAPPRQPARPTVKPGIRLLRDGVLHEPTFIPLNVAIFKEPEPPPEVSIDSQRNGIFEGILGQDVIGSSRPAIPPPPKPAAINRIVQGGIVTAASIISQTRPIYPPLARQAHIQGSVILHAIIDTEGRVAQLEVTSGHPLLVDAALKAVKQWLYMPTLLNGDPVEVDTTITVVFTMGG